jgi:hypothetical protein
MAKRDMPEIGSEEENSQNSIIYGGNFGPKEGV